MTGRDCVTSPRQSYNTVVLVNYREGTVGELATYPAINLCLVLTRASAWARVMFSKSATV